MQSIDLRRPSLAANQLHALENVAHGDGVHAIVLTAAPQIETVPDYVTRGNTAQIGDPAFVLSGDRAR